ncbi:MAG: hypothetical protein M3R30_09555 [Candidatus Eremiobacteraeota bacterium]|nr:hypothetical protein [Candidatus Eremiobacteraeota bacterium]
MTTLRNIAIAAVFALCACSTNPSFNVPPAPPAPTASTPPVVTITPTTGVQITTIGGTGSVTASESGYTGTFTASSTNCAGIATFSPASATGPSASFTITSVANGSCQISIKDSANVVGVINVSVNASGGGGVAQPLTLSTSAATFTTAGANSLFTANETGYAGNFTAANGVPSCAGIATFSPASAGGPNGQFTITSVAAGTCQIKVTDTNGQSAVVNVTVTTTAGSVS